MTVTDKYQKTRVGMLFQKCREVPGLRLFTRCDLDHEGLFAIRRLINALFISNQPIALGDSLTDEISVNRISRVESRAHQGRAFSNQVLAISAECFSRQMSETHLFQFEHELVNESPMSRDMMSLVYHHHAVTPRGFYDGL